MSLQEIRNAIRAVQEQKVSRPEAAAQVHPRENETPDTVILGEVITCGTCLAFLDDLIREPSDGFCPDCGTHLKTMVKQQERKARLLRHFERGGVF